MKNRNSTLNWINDLNTDEIKIDVHEEIKNYDTPVRGIYGIFVKNNEIKECVYVGRSENVYKRFFKGVNAHMVKLKNNEGLKSLQIALIEPTTVIEIEIIEYVPCRFDSYNKDMQRIASRENYHIDYYHAKNQCLEQMPEGSFLRKDKWEKRKLNSN